MGGRYGVRAAVIAGTLLAQPAQAVEQEALAAAFATAMRDAMLVMAQRMARGPECLLSRFGAPQSDPLLVRRQVPGRSLPEGETDYIPLGHSSLATQDVAPQAQCTTQR